MKLTVRMNAGRNDVTVHEASGDTVFDRCAMTTAERAKFHRLIVQAWRIAHAV